jgi:hypothetical protein
MEIDIKPEKRCAERVVEESIVDEVINFRGFVC